jgi:hypothetical protein
LFALYASYFAAHAWAVLRFRYPLDYGEGPLLLQARLLREGSSLANLYADPALSPYAVVNYPPLYLLLSLGLAWFTGDLLLAGRLVSLLATLGSALALWLLSGPAPVALAASIQTQHHGLRWLVRLLIPLAFLALPVVRQWAVLMRVDLLGVCLGLWALLVVQRAARRPTAGSAFLLPLAACLLVASLYVKPSLLAAPLAACVWTVARSPRRGLLLAGLTALLGGGLFLLLDTRSQGWFFFHVVAANANRWDAALAWQFWREQLVQLWPLLLALALATPWLLRASPAPPGLRGPRRLLAREAALPLLYTLSGTLTALGVGKVGAYANYFLELHAGLLWLTGTLLLAPHESTAGPDGDASAPRPALPGWLSPLALIALLLAFARYYPLWDPAQPRQAGILAPNPPRLAFGSYGLWDDQRREWQLLEVFAATQEALKVELRDQPSPLLTDTPGLLVAADIAPRLQAFEHRQLLDQQLWDQGPLLREVANGQIPLAVVDYLGNWLSPELVTLLRHRYAMDGSLGVYSLYRPIALGARGELPAPLALDGLRVEAYYLQAPPGQSAFAPGQILPLALALRREGELPDNPRVLTRLVGERARVERSLPLLYGALHASAWPAGFELQHLQPLSLPADLPPGRYQLEVGLQGAGEALLAWQPLATLDITPVGQLVGEQYLPAALWQAWQALGGAHQYGPGLPMMPAVPFEQGLLQCFERACLDLRPDGTVTRRRLGAIMGLDAPMWPVVELLATQPALRSAATGQTIADPFAVRWRELGGRAALGDAVSPPLDRYGFTVQYTDYARMELAADGTFGLGRVGDDYLRRAPGMPYAWPSTE